MKPTLLTFPAPDAPTSGAALPPATRRILLDHARSLREIAERRQREACLLLVIARETERLAG